MPRVRMQRVLKIGTSLGVVVPAEICRALNIQRGDYVVFGVYSESSVCIKKVSPDELRKMHPLVIN